MKTKEQIIREVINETIGDPNTEKYERHIHQEIALKAMQRYKEYIYKDLYLFIEWLGENYRSGSGVKWCLKYSDERNQNNWKTINQLFEYWLLNKDNE
jgi:hypothetical protein